MKTSAKPAMIMSARSAITAIPNTPASSVPQAIAATSASSRLSVCWPTTNPASAPDSIMPSIPML
jgi:hypothetical protein